MEGRGRRRCKSRKAMVTASFFTFLFLMPQIPELLFHDLFCQRTPSSRTSPLLLPSGLVFHPSFVVVVVVALAVCLFFYFVICLLQRPGALGKRRSWGVGENRGKHAVMPQAVSLLPFLLALMGNGEWYQTSSNHVCRRGHGNNLLKKNKKKTSLYHPFDFFPPCYLGKCNVLLVFSVKRKLSVEWGQEEGVSLFLFSVLSLFFLTPHDYVCNIFCLPHNSLDSYIYTYN